MKSGQREQRQTNRTLVTEVCSNFFRERNKYWTAGGFYVYIFVMNKIANKSQTHRKNCECCPCHSLFNGHCECSDRCSQLSEM